MTAGSCILALDIGSSSARGRLYDERMEALAGDEDAVGRYSWQVQRGTMQIDPAELLSVVAEVLDEAVENARTLRRQIAAVAVTTFWHGLMGLDAAGHPLTPLYGWGDGRAGRAAVAMRGILDEQAYHRRTGCFLQAAYPAMKLAWLSRSDSALFDSVTAWVSIGELLEQEFFGTHRCSLSIASGSGLLSSRTFGWDADILAALELKPRKLPTLVELEPLSGLREEWGARWPSLAAIPWFPAVGDGACANIGSGAIGASRPALTVGTSAAIRVLRPVPDSQEDPPAELWEYLVDRSYRVAGGALSNGGNAIAFLLQRFPSLSHAELDRVLREGEPDAHGLTVLPSLAAERGADWGGDHGATVDGLRLDTTPLDIAEAWLESITHRIAAVFQRIEGRFGPASDVWASGGAVHLVPGWLRTFADAFDTPVHLAADPEATSRGVAILAARELGWIASIETAPSIEGVAFSPEPDRHRVHQAAGAREALLSSLLATTRTRLQDNA